jgi:hypothetical protein
MLRAPSFGGKCLALFYTHNELQFIAGLGRWSVLLGPTYGNRLHLLRSYRSAMPQRSDWGKIDTDQVRIAVNEAIAQAEKAYARPLAQAAD